MGIKYCMLCGSSMWAGTDSKKALRVKICDYCLENKEDEVKKILESKKEKIKHILMGVGYLLFSIIFWPFDRYRRPT